MQGNRASLVEDLAHLSWRDNWFLANFPLTQETVLDYFSGSPFYDPSCNNEQIRMQKLDPEVLYNLVGTEYMVTNQQEPVFFVVEKVYRYNREETKTLQVFYIIQGTVYQAPSLRSLLLSRLSESFFHISESFESLQQASLFSKVSSNLLLNFDREEEQDKVENLEKWTKTLPQEPKAVETSLIDRILSSL
ncbi:Mediator of RNA polymerase II transcription subunit 6 [Galdieria sulphuraria]|uniref:Mediator of RNA polymerase II transcription subunit 6 n=1 Tax=Galdieria sulphuraria TaxID=130081 RepID=M2XHR9_GALSU|nr:transcription regulator [Galdieria sulphuraria]EME29637.1 transcription regulator [Galdieria sulphuraria]GJD12767.1 Mediator of RNA polymerase II transcription subunit 6 [Galdieria sulphuraria]|eukprot:XP_005706157.1 transcription regulator [Galdieria sulphuraria]